MYILKILLLYYLSLQKYTSENTVSHLEILGRLTDKLFIGKVKTKSGVCIYMHIKL